jgi:hypothetical protein
MTSLVIVNTYAPHATDKSAISLRNLNIGIEGVERHRDVPIEKVENRRELPTSAAASASTAEPQSSQTPHA